ncbi:MAG: menaquinone biosynthesis protein [Ferruginibacter sp.]
MAQKIKVGAVSYLNTKPLIYGFEQGGMKAEIELLIDYPANIAGLLQQNKIDIGLIPVAVIPSLKDPHIISDYCISCNGEVASVCLFSDVELDKIETILLDYQSRTSVALLKILLREHWKISPELIIAGAGYEKNIGGKTAGLVIGDRAFSQRLVSKYFFDLGDAWKQMTGLPFVFAAWVSNKELSPGFIDKFDECVQMGMDNLDKIVTENRYPLFNLHDYYTRCIEYRTSAEKMYALDLFLQKISHPDHLTLKIS